MVRNNGQIRDESLRPGRPEERPAGRLLGDILSLANISTECYDRARPLLRLVWRVCLPRDESRGVLSGKLTPEATIISRT